MNAANFVMKVGKKLIGLSTYIKIHMVIEINTRVGNLCLKGIVIESST